MQVLTHHTQRQHTAPQLCIIAEVHANYKFCIAFSLYIGVLLRIHIYTSCVKSVCGRSCRAALVRIFCFPKPWAGRFYRPLCPGRENSHKERYTHGKRKIVEMRNLWAGDCKELQGMSELRCKEQETVL